MNSDRTGKRGSRQHPATSSHPIGQKMAMQMTGFKGSRHRPTSAGTGPFSKAVAHGLAALVDIRCRPYVRGSVSRTGTADPYQPIDALRSCRTAGQSPSRSASTKLPFVVYGGRPLPVIQALRKSRRQRPVSRYCRRSLSFVFGGETSGAVARGFGRASNHRRPIERLQVERATWHCRPTADLHRVDQAALKQPFESLCSTCVTNE